MQKLNFIKTNFFACLLLISTLATAQDFKTTWENMTGTQVFEVDIPTNPNLIYNYTVDWGDGTPIQTYTKSASHTYSSNSSYIVGISGTFPAIFMKASTTQENLVEINQWGSTVWETMEFAFSGCINLLNAASDNPILSNVGNMNYMLHRAKRFDGNLNGWDVSSVKSMVGLFSEAIVFDGDISNWNVSNVTDMTSMFEGATKFNKQITSWNTQNLFEMTYMFARAENFNQDISGFNISNIKSLEGVFENAFVFNQDLSKWTPKNVISMHNMFSGASSFNQDISGWSMSNVNDMSHMFEGAISFDQNLEKWDITSVKDMNYMLSGSGLSDCNYETTLLGWSGNSPSNIVLGSHGLVYYDQTGRNSLLVNNWDIKGDIKNTIDACNLNSDICGLGSSTFFVLEWDLTIPDTDNVINRKIEIPTKGAPYKYDVDWENDGIFDAIGVTGNISHTYPGTTNIYEVAIRESLNNGSFPRIYFWNSEYAPKVTSIVQWGCIQWQTFSKSFQNCTNLTYKAIDAPDLTQVTDMVSMFENDGIFDGDLSSWDLSNVQLITRMFNKAAAFNNGGVPLSWGNGTRNITSTSNAFEGAHSFNQPLNWTTTSLERMRRMFSQTTDFNQDLNNWDVSQVIDMFGLFEGAGAYDNGGVTLKSWDVSKVTEMSRMFMYCPFNQDISTWDVSNVESFWLMFRNNPNFNQDINYKPGTGAWDVSNVTNFSNMFEAATAFNMPLDQWKINNTVPISMAWMFYSASSFDQNLNSWDVSQVTTMRGMFGGANFTNLGTNLNNWSQNLLNVTDMHRMFAHSLFNQDINNWRVDNVVDMSMMFFSNSQFNMPLDQWNQRVLGVLNMSKMFDYSSFDQNITGWDVSTVTNMSSMFANSSFNQDIGGWNVSSVENMHRMFFQNISFNQNLGGWNLTSIMPGTPGTVQTNSLSEIFSIPFYHTGDGMRLNNYDATLIGWATNSTTPNDIAFNALNVSYCQAGIIQSGMSQTAINSLSVKGWDMTPAVVGHINDCSAPALINGNSNQDPKRFVSVENGINSFRIKITQDELESIIIKKVTLYNLNGQLVMDKEGELLEYSNEGLVAGIYVLIIETNKGFETEKIVISH